MTAYKVAIITGASRGGGAALAAAYRRRGWAVTASARTIKPSGDEDLLIVPGDVAEPAAAARVVDAALDRFGRIDTLVNNASVAISRPFTDYTAADFAAVVGVSLAGFFWLTQRAIAEMAVRYGGHVVTVSATLDTRELSAAQPGVRRLITPCFTQANSSRLNTSGYHLGSVQVPQHLGSGYPDFYRRATAPERVAVHAPDQRKRVPAHHDRGRIGGCCPLVEAAGQDRHVS
jgi:NAD(P)-dependent dehydrogenase (short-subunit alcohol dehydrogenase family)